MRTLILLLICSLLPNTASALVSQADAAATVLEAKARVKLTPRVRAKLTALMADEAPSLLQEIANRPPTKSVYCIGWAIAAFGSQSGAECINMQNWQTYNLAFIGIGYTIKGEIQVYRLTATYDSSRYDANFDPIPGQYFLVTQGGTLGLGATVFGGDSGNKKLEGTGLNIGLGGDLGSPGYLRINPTSDHPR